MHSRVNTNPAKRPIIRKITEFDNQSVGSVSTDAVSTLEEYYFDDESTNGSFSSKRSKRNVQKGRNPTARTHIDDAMALQKETNELLAQTISQNDTIIDLLTDLVAKFPQQ